MKNLPQTNHIGEETLKKQLNGLPRKTFCRSLGRIWPALDDKVLLGWNALMASAYAAAFTALGHEEYREPLPCAKHGFFAEKFCEAGNRR